MAAKYKHYECMDCNAVFNLKHDLEERYQVCFCAFCGAELDSDLEDDLAEDEDDNY